MKFVLGVVSGVAAVVGFQQAKPPQKGTFEVDLAEYHARELWLRAYPSDTVSDSGHILERKDLGSAELFSLVSKRYHDEEPDANVLDGECPLKLIRSKELPSLISGHANNGAFGMDMDQSALKATDRAYAEALKANQKYLDELDKAVKIGFKSRKH